MRLIGLIKRKFNFDAREMPNSTPTPPLTLTVGATDHQWFWLHTRVLLGWSDKLFIINILITSRCCVEKTVLFQ